MNATNTIKLKICGMRDAENIMEVAALKPDYMGFIFHSRSPRNVGEAFQVPGTLPKHIKRVGVFVDEGIDTIVRQTEKHSLDYVQLHSKDDTVDFCREVKHHGLKIIKVFSIDDSFDFESTKPYKEIADYFLFDTKGKLRGGNGTVFNWHILDRYDQEVPFFLSGGLSPENIGDVNSLKGMNIHAIDVNSGVEVSPGIKNIEKIKLMQAAL